MLSTYLIYFAVFWTGFAVGAWAARKDTGSGNGE